jgi:hypothetical protein
LALFISAPLETLKSPFHCVKTDIRQIAALLRARLPLLTDFGNAKTLAPRAWDHAATPGAKAMACGRLLALDVVSAAQGCA